MRSLSLIKFLLLTMTAVLVAVGVWMWKNPEHAAGKAAELLKMQPRTWAALEGTPHLESHRGDLVNWMPWGAQAFERAKREGKPIFLSSAFAACHWNRVMQRESFNNPLIAQLINSYFIPVKLDRDEYPYTDFFYQSFVQATTGKSGWPMTVVLTPDGYPFFGGSYFPPNDSFSSNGLKTVLLDLQQRWAKHRALIERSAKEMFELMLAQNTPSRRAALELPEAMDYLTLTAALKTFDPQEGGFSHVMQAPQAPLLLFLLEYAADTPDDPNGQQALDVAVFTLNRMARGALQDQLGGGFFFYTLDRQWKRPYFAKILRTQAQMAMLYLRAWELTQDEYFKQVAERTLAYACNELLAPNQLFRSAQISLLSRDDNTEEDSYYLFSPQQINQALPPELARVFCAQFGIEDSPLPAALVQPEPIEQTARRLGLEPAQARADLQKATALVIALRDKRPKPTRDEKAETGSNALMVSALVMAYRLTGKPEYLEQAERTADALQSILISGNKPLRLQSRDDPAKTRGILPDYVCMVTAFLDLHEATQNTQRTEDWLADAKKIQHAADECFWDRANAGYFGVERPIFDGFPRMKVATDTDLPNANAVATMNLLRLWKLTGQNSYRDKADALLGALGPQITQAPQSHATWATLLRKRALMEQN